MKYILPVLILGLFALVVGFRPNAVDENKAQVAIAAGLLTNTARSIDKAFVTTQPGVNTVSEEHINSEPVAANAEASSFVEYAKTLLGTPYLYGSTDPGRGLDCSGFVNAVSDHFGIDVPRSSVDFTDFGTPVESIHAEPGDLILFTGTDASRRVVGHMGIVTNNNHGELEFIHSSSGKAKGVTISGMDEYYKTRFVKVIRIFPGA